MVVTRTVISRLTETAFSAHVHSKVFVGFRGFEIDIGPKGNIGPISVGTKCQPKKRKLYRNIGKTIKSSGGVWWSLRRANHIHFGDQLEISATTKLVSYESRRGTCPEVRRSISFNKMQYTNEHGNKQKHEIMFGKTWACFASSLFDLGLYFHRISQTCEPISHYGQSRQRHRCRSMVALISYLAVAEIQVFLSLKLISINISPI